MKIPKATGAPRCPTCGKVAYTSQGRASKALGRTAKAFQWESPGHTYRCYTSPQFWHLSSWSKERFRQYEQGTLVGREQKKLADEKRNWRWAAFYGIQRFGVRAAKSIKLPPDRWDGRVNHNPWAAPVTVTIRKRKWRKR